MIDNTTVDRKLFSFPAIIAGFFICGIGTSVALLAVRAQGQGALGFAPLENLQWSDLVVYLTLPLVMLLGILARSVHEQILKEKNPDNIKIKRCLKNAYRTAGFWQAVVVSPIVFAAIYLAIKDEPDLVISYLLSFENGFFWRAVFDSRSRQQR